MKTFDIITEADARVLERGTTVSLAQGGHITPLAHDTLSERRITVVQVGRASGEDEVQAPIADIRSIAIGSDHTGVQLRAALVTFLRARGLAVRDVGTDGSDPVDYPDIAARVARAVVRREADAGVVIDATGIGSAIAANKIAGIRASAAVSETLGRRAREEAGTNVIALGATLLGVDEAKAVVLAWLTTPMRDANAIRRLTKIRDLEQDGPGARGTGHERW
jgi:ribose 5-phosphate isomerase B